MRSRWSLAPLCLAAACGGVADPEALDGAGDEAVRLDALRARAGDTTVWIDPVLTRRGDRLFIAGRASRGVVGGFGFVIDDPYGELRVSSARSFGLWYGESELASLAVGAQQLLRLELAPSATRPSTLTARMLVEPRLVDLAGERLVIDPVAKVVSVGSRPVLRVTGKSDRDLRGLRVSAGDVAVTDFRLDAPRRFVVDLPMDHVVALAGSSARLTITGIAARSAVTKSARIDLAVRSLELSTSDDVYALWPNPVCAAEVRACLAALPSGATDLSSCGAYLEVRACARAGTVATLDGDSLPEALARAARRLTEVGLERDAATLVGAERAASFTDNVHRTVEARYEGMFGQSFGSVSERELALDAAADLVFDTAYARPLDFVEPLEPSGRRAELAADALLGYLATHDLRQTEWGRPLEELTKQFRDRHLAALAELRDPPTIVANGREDTYVTNWLGAVVEITIDRESGEVTHLLFEVD